MGEDVSPQSEASRTAGPQYAGKPRALCLWGSCRPQPNLLNLELDLTYVNSRKSKARVGELEEQPVRCI